MRTDVEVASAGADVATPTMQVKKQLYAIHDTLHDQDKNGFQSKEFFEMYAQIAFFLNGAPQS